MEVRLATADINGLLSGVDDPQVRFVDGHFAIRARYKMFQIGVRAHLDLGDGGMRVAVPFREMTGVPRGLAAMVFHWLQGTIEGKITAKLAEVGLPAELVWIGTYDDQRHGRVATFNLSSHVLNEWLRQRVDLGGLAPRLAGMAVDPGGLALTFQLVPRSP